MPKNKTHKGLTKRVTVTASGKVKHKRRGGSHLNSGQSGSVSRNLRQPVTVHSSVAKTMQEQLGQRLKGGEKQ